MTYVHIYKFIFIMVNCLIDENTKHRHQSLMIRLLIDIGESEDGNQKFDIKNINNER